MTPILEFFKGKFAFYSRKMESPPPGNRVFATGKFGWILADTGKNQKIEFGYREENIICTRADVMKNFNRL